jgi:hypothetical protein
VLVAELCGGSRQAAVVLVAETYACVQWWRLHACVQWWRLHACVHWWRLHACVHWWRLHACVHWWRLHACVHWWRLHACVHWLLPRGRRSRSRGGQRYISMPLCSVAATSSRHPWLREQLRSYLRACLLAAAAAAAAAASGASSRLACTQAGMHSIREAAASEAPTCGTH